MCDCERSANGLGIGGRLCDCEPPAQEHVTRYSDASSYDEVCTVCSATDAPGNTALKKPCPGRAVETAAEDSACQGEGRVESVKHTPGPWLQKTERTVKAGKKTVAICPCDGITGHERDANASLVAAAPELLAAAKEGRTDLMISADNARDAAKTDARWSGVAKKLMNCVAMMDAAIAKAESRP